MIENEFGKRTRNTQNSEIHQYGDRATFYSLRRLLGLCGKTRRTHAILTSGLRSDGYFNVSEVLKYPNIRMILACRLAAQLECAGVNKEDIDLVVSSSYAAFPLGQEISDAMGVPSVYTEKDDKVQKWT